MDETKMVHVVITNVFDFQEYRQIPYSYDRTYALKYAELFGIKKKFVRAVPEQVFLRMKANKAEYEEFEEIHEYYKGVYLTDEDFNFIDSELEDIICEMERNLREIKQLLKFFNSKEAKNVVESIDKLLKHAKKEYGRVDLYLGDCIRIKKFINSYYNEEDKGG